VSSLRTKLQRLGAIGPTSADVPPLAQVSCLPLVQPAPCGDRARVIEQLRQKIARVVARDPVAAPPPWKPSHDELPFVEHPTELGPLYVRHITYDLNHRVGRFPVGGAKRADMTMLSLLALDPALEHVEPTRALFVDTETTGLSGGTGTLVFLVGLAFFDTEGWLHAEQLLLRRPGEEEPILARLSERFAAAQMIVTFNGKAFDLPLIRTRYVMNRMQCNAPGLHLDLLHVARRVHRHRIGACNLGAVETKVLGFGRVDDVPSGEVSMRYSHFLRTGDEGALVGVIEHNAWDVVAMAALMGLYGEPLEGLDGEDLAGVAVTLHRARNPQLAMTMADEAVARGGGAAALRARGMLAKARGDRDRALADFENLVSEVDDPAVRLELAKLYEHHRRAPAAAMQMVQQGTSEPEDAAARRRSRLQRKLEVPAKAKRKRRVAAQGSLPGLDDRDNPQE
jgi:uncharacterized protein